MEGKSAAQKMQDRLERIRAKEKAAGRSTQHHTPQHAARPPMASQVGSRAFVDAAQATYALDVAELPADGAWRARSPDTVRAFRLSARAS